MDPLPWKRAAQPRGEEAAAGDHEAALRTSDGHSFGSYGTRVFLALLFLWLTPPQRHFSPIHDPPGLGNCVHHANRSPRPAAAAEE